MAHLRASGSCLAGIGSNICQSDLELWEGHAQLDRSTCQHVPDLGLGTILLGELGELHCCWAAAPTGKCESADYERTRLGKAATSISMPVAGSGEQARLN